MNAPTLNMPVAVPPRAKIVMAMLSKAAEQGDECPSNAVLCCAIGAESIATPSAIVSLLETMGLITVRRFRRGRVVTIVSTGQSTKEVNGRELTFSPGRRGGSGKHVYEEPARELIEAFADDLAEHGFVARAARTVGISAADGRALFARLTKDLGAQAA